MTKVLQTLLIALIFGSFSNIYSQKKDFGDVSREVLEMEVYEADSTADAVVLFDVADAHIDEELKVKMKRHVRIKILTDNGLDQGEITLSFRHEEPEQRIRKLKVHSFEIDKKGKIKKHKLGRRDKFENEVSDDWSELKFVVPNLSKGSVFEYEYEWESDLVTDLPDWYFQKDIPVVWSEYTAAIPEWFTFLVYKRTYHDFKVDKFERYDDTALFHGSMQRQGFSSNYTITGNQKIDYSGNKYHWVMTDLPAIKDEPYMKAKIDYYAQVQLQLARVQFPNSLAQNVLNTWPSLIKALDKDDDYGKRLRSSGRLRDVANRLISDEDSDLDKMIKLYDHVKEIMKWNDEFGLFLRDDLDDIYESGTGNGSEINLLLTQLLREANLKAHPVVLSTRNHGEIINMYPLANQFNHSIVKVEIGDESYLLDAKNEYRPFSILPAHDLNGNGLLVNTEGIEWVPLQNKQQNKVTDVITISVKEDGSMSGTLQSSNEGIFSFFKDANIFKNEGSTNDNAKNYLFNNSESVQIDSVFGVKNEVMTSSLNFSTQFSMKNNNAESSTFYLKPVFFDDIFESNFSLKERTYPVDFNYPFYKTTILNYMLPNDWKVEEYPESKQYNLGDGGTHRRIIQVNGNVITVRDDFLIAKTRFMPQEYKYLRELFNGVSSDNDNFIVVKKSEP